jgi:hypothetical protein
MMMNSMDSHQVVKEAIPTILLQAISPKQLPIKDTLSRLNLVQDIINLLQVVELSPIPLNMFPVLNNNNIDTDSCFCIISFSFIA